MTQKMQKINFDLSCFKEEFQEYIFKTVNINNYFEFINQYNNQFSIILQSNLKIDEDCTFQNMTSPSIIEDSTEDKEDKDTDILLYPYTIENKTIVIKHNFSIPKKMNKVFMNHGGKLVNKNWVFPLSSLQFVKNLNSNLCIKEIRNEEKRTIIFPTNKHPKLGESVIYDKKGNIGIWDNIIKGWIFQK
jgi:hypothetical protein